MQHYINKKNIEGYCYLQKVACGEVPQCFENFSCRLLPTKKQVIKCVLNFDYWKVRNSSNSYKGTS